MKNLIIIVGLILSVRAQGQIDSVNSKSVIVLLKNNNQLLPFKNLESLSISYDDEKLKKFGERYSENKGQTKVLISSDFKVNSEEEIRVLLLIGNEQNFDPNLLERFQAVIYASNSNIETYDLLSQKLFGGRTFKDTLKDRKSVV